MNKFDSDKWQEVLNTVYAKFGIKEDITAILLFIGIQELGQGFRSFNKQEKTDLIHIATCKVLSYNNYYKQTGHDDENWPLWVKEKAVPKLSLKQQEALLIKGIITYFIENKLIPER